MTTAAPPRPANPTEMTGQVVAEAARRMLPVLAGRLVGVVADRAIDRIDQLAQRLDDYRENGPVARPDDVDDDAAPRSPTSTVLALVVEQARILLDLVVRLATRALAMLRAATERLRERRAPAGIDAEAGDDDDGDVDDDFDVVDGDFEVVDDDELAGAEGSGRRPA